MNQPNTVFSEAHLVAFSRLLSRVLRHEPELVGIRLGSQGWVSVEAPLRAVGRAARAPNAAKRLRHLPDVTREALHAVVASNDKQRFARSADDERIRAVQGHAVLVALKHPIREPPAVLFHGTATTNWVAIGDCSLAVLGARESLCV
jgi:putative RNA 2'-phosphotransferase